MGKKIESIKNMYNLGLPAPGCIFAFEKDSIDEKLADYFQKYQNKKGIYTVRTDTEKKL